MPYSSISEADILAMQPPAAPTDTPHFDSSMDSAIAAANTQPHHHQHHLAFVGSTTVSSNASAKILKQTSQQQ